MYCTSDQYLSASDKAFTHDFFTVKCNSTRYLTLSILVGNTFRQTLLICHQNREPLDLQNKSLLTFVNTAIDA